MQLGERTQPVEPLAGQPAAGDWLPDVIFCVRADDAGALKVEQISESCCAMLGLSAQEILEAPQLLWEWVDEATRHRITWPPVGGLLRRVFAVTPPGGAQRWIEVRATCRRPGEGDDWLIEGVARDVTRDRLRERTHRAHQQQLRSVIEHAPIVMWALDRQGVFELSEGRGLNVLGLKPGQIVGQSVFELYASAPDILEGTRRALAGEEVEGTFDLGFVRYEYKYSPRYDEAGEFIGTIGVATDITRRLRAEAANRQLREAIEQATESVLLVDGAGIITFANSAYRSSTGYQLDEVLDQPWRNLEPRDDSLFLASLDDSISGCRGWRGRLEARRKDGSRMIESVVLSAVRVEDGALAGFVVVKSDITEQTELEARVQHMQKMEAVGQLAGGIAHDFNNLLQVIHGNTGLALASPVEHVQELLVEIDQAARRAGALVRQLLAFSRQDAPEQEPVDVGQLLRGLESLVRRMVGRHLEIEFEVPERRLSVVGNAGQLEQVLVNLAVNARDSMPQGGKLTIELGHQLIELVRDQQHSDIKPGEYVVVHVTDTGCGMRPEVLRRAFEPFFTTKPVGRGTGLGLSTVYAVVRRHHGFVDVVSSEGKGTSFRVYLPCVSAQARPRVSEAPRLSVLGRGRRVLLADDDPQVRRFTRRSLERAGFCVHDVGDGSDAEVAWASLGDELALVVLDTVMPRRSGLAVYESQRAAGQQTPVLFVTGYDFNALAGVTDAPRVAILRKPFGHVEMDRVIGELLGS